MNKKELIQKIVFWFLFVVFAIILANAIFITHNNKQDGTASKTILVNDTTTTKAE